MPEDISPGNKFGTYEKNREERYVSKLEENKYKDLVKQSKEGSIKTFLELAKEYTNSSTQDEENQNIKKRMEEILTSTGAYTLRELMLELEQSGYYDFFQFDQDENKSKEDKVDQLVSWIKEKGIPEDFFEEFIPAYIEYLEDRRKEFEEELPEIKDLFCDKIEDSELFNKEMKDYIKKRVEQVDIDLIGKIQDEHLIGSFPKGVYKPYIDEVYIKKNDKTLIHELFHAVGGSLSKQSNYIDYSDIRGFEGLLVASEYNPEKKDSGDDEVEKNIDYSTTWLNEGVTEKLTRDLFEDKEGEYDPYIYLVEAIIEEVPNLSWEKIVQSYFEPYMEKDQEKYQLDSTREVFQSLNEHYINGIIFCINFVLDENPYLRDKIDNKENAKIFINQVKQYFQEENNEDKQERKKLSDKAEKLSEADVNWFPS